MSGSMFEDDKDREAFKRLPLEDQLRNMEKIKARKDGQIRTLKYMEQYIQKWMDREFKELHLINDDIEHLQHEIALRRP